MVGLKQVPVTNETLRQKDLALVPAPVRTADLGKYRRKNRKWQGIPSIAITERGIFYCACYSGGEGEGPDNYVVVERSADGRNWSEPIAAVDPEGYVRAFDMCLWTAPDGRLVLFWSQSFGGFDGRAGVFMSICHNPEEERLKWSRSIRITDGVMLNKPIIGRHGEWLLALSLWNNVPCQQADMSLRGTHMISCRNSSAPQTEISAGIISNDIIPYAFGQGDLDRRIKLYEADGTGKHVKDISFRLRGGFDIEGRYYDEPMAVQKIDGSLWMLFRLPDGIGEAFSSDEGRSWENIRRAGIWGPDSRFYIGRLKSGRLLMVNHLPEEGKAKRSNLTAWLSRDDGMSWSGRLILDEREDVSYPDAAEDREGNIYIIYDYSRFGRKEILLCSVTEEEILAGKIYRDASFTKRVIDKAGE